MSHEYAVKVHNPHASDDQPLTVAVTSNIPLEAIFKNVETNSKRDLEWVKQGDDNETPIVIVGGGPSLADELETIRKLGSVSCILAVNGAAKYLADHDIYCDIQFIMDARKENIDLVCKDAGDHVFASQCDPSLFDAIPDARLVHLHTPGIEEHVPQEKVDAGDYVLIGGAGSVGISAMTLAYSMGFRDMHLFGFDSSIRAEGGLMHAYEQPMNEGEQLILDRLGGQAYWMSYTMAVQYQYFPQMEAALESMGCKITVYGSGILPDRWKLKQNLKSEKEKYEYVWSHKEYGNMSPAEMLWEQIDEFLPNCAEVVDLGCGVGRAGVKLAGAGHDVTLMDFASNSRCDEALSLEFIEHDLSEPLPATWGWGYCCDVMEHIPPEQVDTVLKNIRNGVDNVFFRIEHHMDGYGPALIGSPLHLSVHDETWWKAKLHEYWPSVECRGDGIFLATTDEW